MGVETREAEASRSQPDSNYRRTLRNLGTRQVAQDATRFYRAPQEQWGERTMRSAMPESTKQSMNKKPSQRANEDWKTRKMKGQMCSEEG